MVCSPQKLGDVTHGCQQQNISLEASPKSIHGEIPGLREIFDAAGFETSGHLPGTCPKRRFSPWFLGETEVSTMGNSEARKVGEGHFINCDVS